MRAEAYHTPMGEIHYWVSEAGENRPWLVFLPGLTADHHLFDRQTEAFAKDYNCLVWDAPAHGASRPFLLDFYMDGLTGWLHHILQREGAVRPVLVGQSMGGYLSQVYLELYPEGAGGFLSIDSCPLKREYYTGWELALRLTARWPDVILWPAGGLEDCIARM